MEAYVFAVTVIESRPLLWTVHTIDGAVYSRIPTAAIAWKEKPTENSIDRWGAISSHACVISHGYLKDYSVELLKYKGRKGRYGFTIDFFQDGFAEDPEQHKTSNVIFGDGGEIMCLPNNELLFLDHHFTSRRKGPLPYRRNTTYYL